MKAHIREQIIKTAAITSPVIATLVVTPLYVMRGEKELNFFLLWLIVFIVAIALWYLNVLIINVVKSSWTKTWIRIIISSIIMLCIGTILLKVSPVNPFSRFDMSRVAIIRCTYVVSINSIIFILLDLIFTRETALQLNKEIAELKFSNLEAEYKLLKDQLNPHFLFNALNISKSLIKKQPDEAEKYIVQLSDFLRATVNNHQKSASLKDELELGGNYIALQKVRFGNALNYSVNINEAKEGFHLPFFTLVSLIENAIKHNSFTDKKPLEVSIYTEDDFVFVKNNLQAKFVLASSKTGLININERSKLLSGNEIEIINNEIDFIVKIKLISV